MDIESINPNFPWKTLFQSLTTHNTINNNSKNPFLTNTFATSIENSTPSVSLTLTKDHIFISDCTNGQSKPVGQVPLSFDIKFEVLHQ